jgi:glutaminyl-peptide cyclotransferase
MIKKNGKKFWVLVFVIFYLSQYWGILSKHSNHIPEIRNAISPIPATMNTTLADQFNRSLAFASIESQLNFGYRIPGTPAHDECYSWLQNQMVKSTETIDHNFTYQGIPCYNLLAKYNTGHKKIIAFASHWDSRAISEYDPNSELRNQPVAGANDGASGVAVMIELSHVLNESSILWDYEFWFLFFDAEDQGNNGLSGWDWIVGSSAFANELTSNPLHYFRIDQSIGDIEVFILLDMVGGLDVNFIYESNSNQALWNALAEVAVDLGYSELFSDKKYLGITDDHVPFKQKGIPVADLIIKFWDRTSSSSWSYHHTTGDTLTHISQVSLVKTGRVLLQFIYEYYRQDSSITPPDFHTDTSLFDNLSPGEWALILSFGLVTGGVLTGIGVWYYRKKVVRIKNNSEKKPYL